MITMIVEIVYDPELDQEVVDTLNAMESAADGLLHIHCKSKVQE